MRYFPHRTQRWKKGHFRMKTTSHLKNSRLRSRIRQKPMQKRSPPHILADEHFKEAFNPPQADY